MENEKYYTPEIDEFYPGFEFEVKEVVKSGLIYKGETKYVSRSAIWVKAVLRLSLISKTRVLKDDNGDAHQLSNWSAMDYTLLDVEKLLSDNRIRVKHLDREAIEAEGWVFEEKKYFMKNKAESFRKSDENVFSLFITETSYGFPNVIIKYLIDGVRVKFDGTIRNASELRKIMKMLNIEKP